MDKTPVYVAVVSFGYLFGEGINSETIYAGLDRDEAVRRITAYDFPNKYGRAGVLYTWVNGQQVKHEAIIE